MRRLILSIFPGIDLLGRAFEEVFGEEACLVRGPDVLWGGDIRHFHPPAGVFDGVIGGDPCQAHSVLNRINRSRGIPSRYPDMTGEFARVVAEAQPLWFLRENVPQAPGVVVPGYQIQTFVLNNRWLGEVQSRKRRFWFGCRREVPSLLRFIDVAPIENPEYAMAVISTTGHLKANGQRWKSPEAIARIKESRKLGMEQRCELQGLPRDFLADAPFTLGGKKRVIANGVPLPMGRAIAQAIRRALEAVDERRQDKWTCNSRGDAWQPLR